MEKIYILNISFPWCIYDTVIQIVLLINQINSLNYNIYQLNNCNIYRSFNITLLSVELYYYKQ